MKKIIILSLVASFMLTMSCSKKKADDPLAESGRTQRTENMLANLREISAKG